MSGTRDITVRDGDRVVVTVEIPAEEQARRRRKRLRGQASPQPMPEGAPTCLIEPYDVDTRRVKVPDSTGSLRDDYVEVTKEGPVSLGFDDTVKFAASAFTQARDEPMAISGREERNTYRLQVDSQTGVTENTYELVGPYGSHVSGLAVGAPDWKRGPTLAEQKAGVAALRAISTPLIGFDGLSQVEAVIAQKEREQYAPVTDVRVHAPGHLEMHVPEGPYALKFVSPYNYMPFWFGDPSFARNPDEVAFANNFKVVRGESFFSPEVRPPDLRLASYRAERVEIQHVAQNHEVIYQWLDGYLISAYATQLTYIPQTGSMTMRSGFYPTIFHPEGTPSGDANVGESMSERIGKTIHFNLTRQGSLAYAQIMRLFGVFLLVCVQGRYAIYQKSHPAYGLCAIVRVFRPGRSDFEQFAVFQRETVIRPRLRIEVNGLYIPDTQPVIAPWFQNYFNDTPSDIGVGI